MRQWHLKITGETQARSEVRRIRLFLLVCVSLLNLQVFASDYGTTGLIDVPSARFDDDGTFAVSISRDERHKQFSITYQATPWLQGTFRYTGFNEFFHWDRNYELKARLWEEELYLPQVAVGVRDIVGTGIFGSEYVVANKKIGRSDYTFGVGWGRLSGKGILGNPLTEIDSRFERRSADVGLGGEFSLGNFFSGSEIGFFGGIRHQFETLPLTGIIEYNPDQYDWDLSRGGERPQSPWSLGLAWEPLKDIEITLSIQHQNEIGFGLRSALDSKNEPPRRESDTFISSYYLPSSKLPPQIQKEKWYDRLLYDSERSGLLLIEGNISADGGSAKLVVGNSSHQLWADAIGRLTALADLHLPATVRSIYFVVEEAGHRTVTLNVPRPSTSYSKASRTALRRTSILSGRTDDSPQYRTSFVTKKINTTVNLRSKFQLFDPDDPARYQIYAEIGSEFALNNHWAIRSSLALNIDQNFDESKRQNSNSVLPKVRSDVVRYLVDGDSGIERFLVEGRDTIGRSFHYRAFGGYLEQMFAGTGGEVLYWPHKSRLAFGASLALAQQRDFDRGFGLRDYKVVTGHLSAYWASPFYNYDFAIHAGQYLAKDKGATFEARRTFRNGWQIGVWATLTDVPFEDFGEGSFDKGMYFQIPLEGFFGSGNRSNFSTFMRPIQRDGGQRLENYSGTIFWALRNARFDAFESDSRLLP